MTAPAAALTELLGQERGIVMPCCWDALSARMIERAGFPLTFMSGFAVSASRAAKRSMFCSIGTISQRTTR